MAVEKNLCKLTTVKGKSYYLLLDRNSTGEGVINLLLSDGTTCWIGDLSEEDLATLSADYSMDIEAYTKQTIMALTLNKSLTLTFQYEVKVIENQAELTWKKHVPADDVRIKLGSVVLEETEDSSSNLIEILDFSIQNTTKLQDQIKSLESDNERLASERAGAVKRLEKWVKSKEDMEKDMYEKFVSIINSKKRKIRELKAGRVPISQDEADPPTASGSNVSGSKLKNNAVNEDGGGGDILDRLSDYDTDEENQKEKPDAPTQSKSKKTREASQSLFDDDDSPDKPAPKRRRQRVPSKKQTPAKPALPRVSTPQSTSRSGSRTSMRKTSSNKSSNIDADDLLDDL